MNASIGFRTSELWFDSDRCLLGGLNRSWRLVIIIRTETVSLTPDKSLMEKIGYVGFSADQALAEFVDNALDAKYDEETGEELIEGRVSVNIIVKKDSVTCEDNSSGIKNAGDCLRLGHSLKKGRLGTFGLGLKTAAMSLGRRFTIESGKLESSETFRICIDLDKWYENPEWQAKAEYYTANSKDHWTRITVEKLHVDFDESEIRRLREQLGFRFSEFIENKELDVKVNGYGCIYEQPLFIDRKVFEDVRNELGIHPDKLPDSRKNFHFDLIDRAGNELHVKGWVDLLQKGSLIGRFGFNLYRGRRLIDPFQKIGVRNHPAHARIFGHVYLPSGFPVTFTKDAIEIQREIAFQLKEKLKEAAFFHRKISERLASKRRGFQLRKGTLTKLADYLKAIEEATKKSKLIKDLWEGPKKRARSLPLDSEGFGLTAVEKRAKRRTPSLTRPIPRGARVRQPGKKRQQKKSFYVTVGGRQIKILHDFQAIEDPPIQMYYNYYDEENSEFQVVTNTFFDSWGLTRDEAFYAAMNIIDALTELFISEAERKPPPAWEIKDELWRLVGKIAYRSLAA